MTYFVLLLLVLPIANLVVDRNIDRGREQCCVCKSVDFRTIKLGLAEERDEEGKTLRSSGA